MKKLVLLFVVMNLAACKSDDDVSFNKGAISGNWKMTGFFAYMPELPPIEKGLVVWNINANTITMTNNSPYAYVSNEGRFNYRWINSEIIVVNYQQFDTYYKVDLSNNKLRLTHTVAPGSPEFSDPSTLEFEK